MASMASMASSSMAAISGCSRCRVERASRSFAQTCLGLRTYVRSVKPRPSRMVLSDHVHRAPTSRDSPKERGPATAGPFSGMNRTVANVNPRRSRLPRAGSRSGTGRRASEQTSTGADDDQDAALGDADASSGSFSPRLRRSRESRQRYKEERKALNMQRALAIVTYGQRASIKERLQQFETFEQFDLLPKIQQAIVEESFKGMSDVRPTPVQRLAIPALLGQPSPRLRKKDPPEKGSFLLAAETGSGKTLAYLLPAIDALKTAEARDPDIQAYQERQAAIQAADANRAAGSKKIKPFNEPHPTMARPRVIVLVPSAELAHQVMRVSKTLSHAVKFKTEVLSSELKPQTIQRNLYGPKGLDVVVSTPHLLASIAKSDPHILSRVTHLIVDEADSLFDRSFSPVTVSIIERAASSMTHFICCSATIPRRLNSFLATNFPDMVRLTTPNLHAIPRRVQLGVIDVSKDPYRNNKDLACADVLFSLGREAMQLERPAAATDREAAKAALDVRRVLVFVNERTKAEELANYLQLKGVDAEALHRDTEEKRHSGEALETFTSADPLRISAQPEAGRSKRDLRNVKVLVVTDLASRGIDTLAVRHVILYDMPHTTIDFIHRLGRAGRMGRRGRGIVLVGNDDRKDVVAEVKKSMFMGQALI